MSSLVPCHSFLARRLRRRRREKFGGHPQIPRQGLSPWTPVRQTRDREVAAFLSSQAPDCILDAGQRALATEHLHHLKEWWSSGAAADSYPDRAEKLPWLQTKLHRQFAHRRLYDIVLPLFQAL